MTIRKVTSEEKQAIADMLGIEVDKIPGEVDWDDNENDEDDDEENETEEPVAEEDEEDEDGEDDEEDEEPEDDEELDDEDDEDDDADNDEKIRQALIEYEAGDKSIPFSEFCKNKGL